MTDTSNPVRSLAPAERNLDPYLHIDPCYLNVATTTALFGYYFKEFFLSRTIKENTDYARIFNDHLLATFAMDACRDREVRTLGEILIDPTPGQVFCSTEHLAGTESVFKDARARNRVVLPYDYGKDVFIEFDPHHFLSRTERAQHGEPSTTSVMCHLDLVKDDLLSATALVMGTPSFTHFRNHGAALELSDHAPDWFETWPEDIIELAACADIAPPADSVWRKALAEIPTAFVYQALVEILGGARLARRQGEDGANSLMIAAGVHRKYVEPDPDLEKTGDGATPAAMVVVADTAGRELAPADLRDRPDAMAALSATPAELWIVQHCNTIGADIREMVREFAVRPHAPRRFCLIDGADTWRILKAYGKL